MNNTPKIFNERLVNGYLNKFTRDDIPDFDKKFGEIKLWCDSAIRDIKEVAIQGTFMTRVFNQVLGYKEIVDIGDCYNQERENTTVLDSTEADGALGFFHKAEKRKDVRAVVELKGAKIDLDKRQSRHNYQTPVEQGFGYANKNGSKCGWVIVCNYVELRLYKSTSSLEYEVFDMLKMNDEKEFLRFYFFLCKDNLICENGKSVIDKLYDENEAADKDITDRFYKTYKAVRNNLFVSLKENNPDADELMLFGKSQKLMDRFVFICFCEDCNLLPANTYKDLIESAKHSFTMRPNKLWEELKGLFDSIDRGNPPMKINRYNGGLFKFDPELNALNVPDETLESFTELSEYDFKSDLNVNILGHIFEQSISDVEQIKEEINGQKSSKQKDDGIFYTPDYVTRYIVEQTVGVYLKKKKEELKKTIFRNGDVTVSAVNPTTRKERKRTFGEWADIPPETPEMTDDERMEVLFAKALHLVYWNAYEDVLRNIKICDPACGSGAFLNQCFDYLKEEAEKLRDTKYGLGAVPSLFDIDKDILQKNLYGVDLNEESVEITKLSLWLKTAKSNETLASLDDNIKCGNSLVEDESVVRHPFDWKEGFPEVFAEGGFDVIVGNPPYGAKVDDPQKEYFKKHFKTHAGEVDTYRLFFELGFDILKPGGYLGYITPNTYFNIKAAGALREFLFGNTLLKVVELYNVFPDAVVEPLISVYQKKSPEDEEFEIILVPRKTALTANFIADGVRNVKRQSDLRREDDFVFNYKLCGDDEKVVLGVWEKAVKLSDKYYVWNGAKPYSIGRGNPPQTAEIQNNKIYNGYNKIDETWVPYARGRRIQRFTDMWDGEYIKYGENLAEPRNPDIFFREKIFIRQTGDTIIAQFDTDKVSNNTLHVVFSKDDSFNCRYLLGLLNSTLMSWFYQKVHSSEVGKTLAEVKKVFVEDLPFIAGTPEQVTRVEAAVEGLLKLCQERWDGKKSFLDYIRKRHEPKKISERLEEFDKLSFRDFCAEMKKQKMKLSALEEKELLPLFEADSKNAAGYDAKIKRLQKELDDTVFEIYGIDSATAERIRGEMIIEL